MRKLVALGVLMSLAACGGGSSSPSTPLAPVASAEPPSSQPRNAVLVGRITAPGGRVSGATVSFLDGPNAGRSATTDADGEYRIERLTAGNANVSATSTDYEERRSGVTLSNGPNTLNFTTRTQVPWRMSGYGNVVFDMPTYIESVRINGRWTGDGTSRFIVRINGRRVVNELVRLVGVYDEVHVINRGGAVEVEDSAWIIWTFTEERTP